MSYINKIRRIYATQYPFSRPKENIAKLLGLFKFILTHKIIYLNNGYGAVMTSALQFNAMAKYIRPGVYNGYVYPLDYRVVREMNQNYQPIASVTVDYSKLIAGNLYCKSEDIDNMRDSDFKHSLTMCLDGIRTIISNVCYITLNNNKSRFLKLRTYFDRMLDKPCESFDEAIQRILFYNGLFWQNKYKQNGIGRLDLILYPYYKADLEKGVITNDSAKQMLHNMYLVLGKDMAFKSAALLGDTGQVIILGGIDEQGKNVENEITHMLLEIFTENPKPDPKLILRVNSHTSDELWRKAIKCILRGSGSPLLMNEDVIMPLMKSFGYATEDVYNFGTSACWEPLIIGKSLDQNNCIKNITILDALETTLSNYSNDSYQSLLDNLKIEIAKRIAEHDLHVEFDRAPILSLFFDDCIKKEKDFSEGGAKYNHHGLLVVGLPNLINSILNIKKYVFDTKLCSLKDCLSCILNDYAGHEDLRLLFKDGALKFGSDSEEVVSLTNHIMEQIGTAVAKRTMFGEKIKVGFSSPSYIGLAKEYPASLDGRHKGDPFAVHISPISSNIDISEILDFASSLKYEGNRMNGNVVDFIVPASYTKNPDKLVTILKTACKKGIFELQLNVLDKKTLIDAKAHPEKYPNLIVRVWGFSAYFNDLPEEYKDNLIQRAELYE